MIRRARDFFRELKWRYQRATRGYSDLDLWDLGSSWREHMIISLRAHINLPPMGHPGMITYEEWLDILNEIVDGLEASKHTTLDCDCWEDDFQCQGNLKEHREKYRESMRLLSDWMFAIWD